MASMTDTVYTKEDRFNVSRGLYWYCAHYHGGQNSEEYRVLSQLDYRPGRMENGPEDDTDSTAQAVYDDLASGQLTVEDVYTWIESTGE